ncbi:ureidoglycolate dehydrogenase [Thalassobacillus sp. CUG 92003]|uniref:ureidoglycolate dehydrogenase n=1 Tax=Thalassobacillus sp. CUG 92003 TaxID=2736641 RepID=UPI0015E7DC67|nr:ureidoglycolate dehydrogenase [Thalassobacillus sp. CUG 92003]
MATVNASHVELKELVMKKLKGADMKEHEADIVADVLIHADLRGVHSHGVMRTEHYVKRLTEGGLKTAPEFKVQHKGKAAALFDGDHGLGHVIMKEAMDEGIQLAQQQGIGAVGVINSSHCGALSYFAEQAAEQDVISMIVTQTDSAVAPFGGAEAYFGTNPVAYGFPAGKHAPIILDMATSNVALGKILHAREKGESIPDNWGVDENGQAVTNPEFVKSLLPVGGPKGYGLSMMVDILSGVLTGSSFGPSITKMYDDYQSYRRLGHMIITLDAGLFTEKEAFLSSIDDMIDELHRVQPAPGFKQVLLPGEPEQMKYASSLSNGVDVPKRVYDYLVS